MIMKDCLFCKIAAGEIPSSRVYEDDKVIGFRDIAPQAPVHIVFIPKEHILSSADDINEENSGIIADIFVAIAKAAKQLGLKNGYRIINNCGSDGCQSVKHIHFHLLGGEQLPEKIV